MGFRGYRAQLSIFLMEVILAALAGCVCLAESSGPAEVKIISPRRILTIRGNFLSTPAEWETLQGEIPYVEEGSSRIVLFNREGIHPFLFHSGSVSADVVLISKTNRITQVFESIRAGCCYAGSKQVMAIAFLPGGYCGRHEIRAGHLVDIVGISLKPAVSSASLDEDIAAARIRMEKNLSSFPGDCPVMESLGNFYIGIEDYPAAEKIFETLILTAPTAYRYNRLAQIKAMSGHWVEVDDLIHQAMVMEPQNILSYQMLLRIPRQTDEADPVVTELLSVLEKYPDFNDLRYELARYFLLESRLDTAEKILEYTASEDEQNAGFQRIRGDICLRRGEYRPAAEAYAGYLQVFPYDPHAADLRAFITVHALRKDALGL